MKFSEAVYQKSFQARVFVQIKRLYGISPRIFTLIVVPIREPNVIQNEGKILKNAYFDSVGESNWAMPFHFNN